jgi:hypothetical protein
MYYIPMERQEWMKKNGSLGFTVDIQKSTTLIPEEPDRFSFDGGRRGW